MYISMLRLLNWKNFKTVDVPLVERMFVVGPNASGKSNLLDVFLFLKDIAGPAGGLQKALKKRGGLMGILNLAVPKNSRLEIEIGLTNNKTKTQWIYELHLCQKKNNGDQFKICRERVVKNGDTILDRPDPTDKQDPVRLTQTGLEQVIANKDFRELTGYFSSIGYMHLVPQLIRYSNVFPAEALAEDPLGRHFIERIAKTPEKTRKNFLKKIEEALRLAVPQLKDLNDTRDELGFPHLEMNYRHWHPRAGMQREDRFSDGTLRLVGLFWSLLENKTLLLLEEPELSLHDTVVDKLPSLIHRLKKTNSQVFISTHSQALLADRGIGGEEILVLKPGKEGTTVNPASNLKDACVLLESGMSPADVVIPISAPENIEESNHNLALKSTLIFA